MPGRGSVGRGGVEGCRGPPAAGPRPPRNRSIGNECDSVARAGQGRAGHGLHGHVETRRGTTGQPPATSQAQAAAGPQHQIAASLISEEWGHSYSSG